MLDRMRTLYAPALLLIGLVLCMASGAIASDTAWTVSKASGDVSVTTAAGQEATLAAGTTLKPGDNVRTGQNGRALLMRGEESILISPNSAIGIPAEKKSELSTTIIQQAGSILLEVEKRNVKHFQVETPYLAAVVKGTQFRVTVNEKDSRVDVLRGQVEVTDFKSGQFALVTPGQAAEVSTLGTAGLSLSGTGLFGAVQQGTPRSASMMPAPASNERRLASITVPPVSPVRTWSSAAPSNDEPWTSSMTSWGSRFFGTSGRRSHQEDFALAAMISCAVGFAVAIAVGAQRRRKGRKLAKG